MHAFEPRCSLYPQGIDVLRDVMQHTVVLSESALSFRSRSEVAEATEEVLIVGQPLWGGRRCRS